MSKKIIFIGPPEAGKTTLRKIFFEGEDARSLLEHGIEPTYGVESININFEDMVGVFDLSGQENQRWMETEDESIFFNTNAIIIVMDVKMTATEIIDFPLKIIKKRDELSPNSKIYLFLHKIDLINKSKLQEINNILFNNFSNIANLSIFNTTIKEEEGYYRALSIFINILKNSLNLESSSNQEEFENLNFELKILKFLNEKGVLIRNEILNYISIPETVFDSIIDRLITKEFVKYSNLDGVIVIKFTEEGKEFFKKLSKIINVKEINKIKAGSRFSLPILRKIPIFVGYIISDNNGIMITRAEIHDGAIEEFLWNSEQEPEIKEMRDINLIPMFINAIEKFSLEINMKDLSGFKLEGTNVKVEILNINDYTIIFFLNPSTNIKRFKNIISNHFSEIFQENADKFENFRKTGDLTSLEHLKKSGRKWLIELTKSYSEKMINLEIFDLETAKILMKKLDDLYEEIKTKFTIDLEKIKELKMDLTHALLKEDLDKIKIILESVKSLRLKYT